MDKEVSEKGLNIMQSLAAKTGANFQQSLRKEKFHGSIYPTKPIGSRKIMDKYFSSKTLAEPSSAMMQPEKYLK